jgi:surfeit locus 1 family protein
MKNFFEYTVHSVVGSRRFRPSILGVALTVLGVAGCVRLAVWQLDRAEEKRGLITAFASGGERALVVKAALEGLPRYQSVELSGHYDTEHQVLLDNMFSARGQPGYQVLTALQRESGAWVLVDRGWVPAGNLRAQLPKIDVDGRVRVVRGQLDQLPRPGIRLGNSADAGPQTDSWPKVLNYPTHQQLTAALGRPLENPRVLLSASAPDGYERQWQANVGLTPERHLGYAVTWIGLLVTILVTFVVVSVKQVADEHAG